MLKKMLISIQLLKSKWRASMQYNTQQEYRYSGGFWLKKLLLLLGLILCGIAFWWLWQWEDDTKTSESTDTGAVESVDTDGDGINDDEDTDDDNDGFSDLDEEAAGSNALDANSVPATDTDGDGFSDDEEATAGSDANDVEVTPENYDADGDGFAWNVENDAGSDPDDVTSTPDTVDANSSGSDSDPITSSATVTTTASGATAVEQYGNNDCAYQFYLNGTADSATNTHVIVSTCENDDSDRDFTWTHTVGADGSLSSTSSPVAYCVNTSSTDGCSSGNGVLEVMSEGELADSTPVRVSIVDTTGINETNAVAELVPIIESITVN